MSKNQYGTSGLPVRAPLNEKIDRYQRMKAMKDEQHLTLDQIAFREGISRERARQILGGGPPKMPGRPLDKR
jgi:DNA-directed RNA polymerase sigma subunit (sigma70/sigma32)